MFKISSIIAATGLFASILATPAPVAFSDPLSAALNTRALDARDNAVPKCYYADLVGAWHYAVLIPDDDKYDSPGNCGGGFLDNLHGQSLTITTWGCTYGWGHYPQNSAVADFYTTIATTDQVQKAYNAATGGLSVTCEEVKGPAVILCRDGKWWLLGWGRCSRKNE